GGGAASPDQRRALGRLPERRSGLHRGGGDDGIADGPSGRDDYGHLRRAGVQRGAARSDRLPDPWDRSPGGRRAAKGGGYTPQARVAPRRALRGLLGNSELLRLGGRAPPRDGRGLGGRGRRGVCRLPVALRLESPRGTAPWVAPGTGSPRDRG